MTIRRAAAFANRRKVRFSPISSAFFAVALAGALAAPLAGCGFSTPLAPSSKTPDSPADQAQAAQFTDIPIPAGARMDLDRSLVLGPRDSWIGRLVFTSSAAPNDVFEFYARELPRFNWTGITAVRAGTSVLSYSRDERIATVQISRTTLGGSEVLLTISPRSNGANGGNMSGVTNGGGFNLPAVSAPPVSRQPLR